MADPQAPRRARPHLVVHAVASVDGRVSLGPGRTGFEDVGDARWQAIWSSDVDLEQSVRDLVARFRPQVVLEGSGSFVREGDGLLPLPPVPLGDAGATDLLHDYLPDVVVGRPGHQGWFAVVDGRGRVRAGMTEFPGWEGWHTLHLVSPAAPLDYLAFLRDRRVPYLVTGGERVDLAAAMAKLSTLLGIERVVCTAGSRLNGALLRAGLVDELSLVLLPALIGGERTPHLFRSPELGPVDWPASLELVSVDGEPSGRVRLHYRLAGDAVRLGR
jgi:riboflavin biosynthesis pyrimidine reductase